MKSLLVVTAVMEAGAGVALLGFPATTVELLLSPSLDTLPSMTLFRVVGGLLLGVGIACWFASRDTLKPCARRMVIRMTVYNTSGVVLLGVVGMSVARAGILLWPTVVIHAAMAVRCVVCLLNTSKLSEVKGTP
jgi:uncharacterized RDD family membrane protein YckC